MASGLIRTVLDKVPVPVLEQSVTSLLAPCCTCCPTAACSASCPWPYAASWRARPRSSPAWPSVSPATSVRPGWRPSASTACSRIKNPRVPPRLLLKGLSHRARATVAQEQLPYLVVAVDPVTFEKAYPRKLEGVSTVRTSTPHAAGRGAPNAGLSGHHRHGRHYPRPGDDLRQLVLLQGRYTRRAV